MRAAMIAILGLLVVGLTTASSGEQAGTVLRSELAGQQVRLSMPTGEAKPKGVVIWFHGQGGDVNAHADGPFLGALHRNGYAIATSDFHLQSWGNAASTNDAKLLIEWAKREADAPVVLWGAGSMGGATSLNALLHGAEQPPCWYGVHPAIALSEMHSVPGAPGFIRKAYGGPPPLDRDPVRNVASLPTDVRYRIVASPDDRWVQYDENVTPLINGLKAGGAEVSSLAVTGPHQDPSHWNAQDVLAFTDSCAEGVADSRAAATD